MRISTILTIAIFANGHNFVHGETMPATDADDGRIHSLMFPTNSIFETFHQRYLGSGTSASTSGGDQPSDLFKVSGCKPMGQCELCPGGKRSGKTACEETGRRQEFLCHEGPDIGGDDDGSEREVKYQSCKRSAVDEEYLMFRFQAMCVMIAFIAIRSVRREKMLSESLFDQRKRKARLSSDLFTPLTSTAAATFSGMGSSSNDSSIHNGGSRDGSEDIGSFDEDLDTSRKAFDKV